MKRILAAGMIAVMIAGCSPAEAEPTTTTTIATTLPDTIDLPKVPEEAKALKNRFKSGEKLTEEEHDEVRMAFLIDAVEDLRENNYKPRYSEIKEAGTVYGMEYDDGSSLMVSSGEDEGENVLNLRYSSPTATAQMNDIFRGMLQFYNYANVSDLMIDVLDSLSSENSYTHYGTHGDLDILYDMTGSSISIVQGWDLK